MNSGNASRSTTRRRNPQIDSQGASAAAVTLTAAQNSLAFLRSSRHKYLCRDVSRSLALKEHEQQHNATDLKIELELDGLCGPLRKHLCKPTRGICSQVVSLRKIVLFSLAGNQSHERARNRDEPSDKKPQLQGASDGLLACHSLHWQTRSSWQSGTV